MLTHELAASRSLRPHLVDMGRTDHLGETPLYPRSKYASELRAALPADAFELSQSRLALLPVHVAVIAAAIVTVANGWLPWLLVPLVSLVIGISFACLTFVAHEALHGGIVRGRALRHVVGWIAFLPFAVSPRLWVTW